MTKDGRSAACEQVLVLATPGRVRDGLGSLLRTLPWLQIVGQVDECVSALNILRQQPPKLVLLDLNLPNNQAWGLLELIKAEYPQTRCIVFVDTFNQQKAARDAGADATLLKGFATAELFVAINSLLFGPINPYNQDKKKS